MQQILIFGQLKEITGSDTLVLPGIADTKTLVAELNNKYPRLASVKYIIAVDKKVVTDNMIIGEKSIIALMPPFSGG
jgi:molybdopterin synthase sulfur carrier subunit